MGLVFFIDTTEKFRSFVSYSKSVEEGSWPVLISYLFSSLIVYFVNFLPFVIALTGAITFVLLNKTGQLMALYSFGLNHHRVFRFPFLLTFGVGLIVMFLNLSYLPNTIRNIENYTQVIKGQTNKTKSFILEEKFTFQNQSLETNKNNHTDLLFPLSLNPPVYQIISYSEIIDRNNFKKIVITRLDEKRKVRQRLLLFNCVVKDGFSKGEDGLIQDYFPNGDLFKETNITKENPRYIKLNIYGKELVELMSLFEAPEQTSFAVLLKNFQIKVARDEIYRRLLLPFKCILLLLLSLAFSCWFNLKNIYMCFVVLILVALVDMFADAIPALFFASSVSAIPLFITPLFLYLVSKMIFKKTAV